MSPWEVMVEYSREKIVDEFKEQGIDQEQMDPLGEGIEMSILPDVLAGTPVNEAVRDWVEWKIQDAKEREEEDNDLFRRF